MKNLLCLLLAGVVIGVVSKKTIEKKWNLRSWGDAGDNNDWQANDPDTGEGFGWRAANSISSGKYYPVFSGSTGGASNKALMDKFLSQVGIPRSKRYFAGDYFAS